MEVLFGLLKLLLAFLERWSDSLVRQGGRHKTLGLLLWAVSILLILAAYLLIRRCLP